MGGLNTLALDARARYLCTAATLEDLLAARDFARARGLSLTVLGGGSNVILAGDIHGLVVRVALPGIAALDRAGSTGRVRAGAGEDWHALVGHCLARGWFGLENLALIPGRAGAAPIQNIGASRGGLASPLHHLPAPAPDPG